MLYYIISCNIIIYSYYIKYLEVLLTAALHYYKPCCIYEGGKLSFEPSLIRDSGTLWDDINILYKEPYLLESHVPSY